MIIVEENLIIVGGGGGGASSLDDLTDVDTTGVSGGEYLVYQAADPNMGITAGWVPRGITLSALTDVDNVGAPGAGDYLGYNTDTGYWETRHLPLSDNNVILGPPSEADVLAYIAGDGGWVNHQLVLDDIRDIDLTGVSAGNILVYNTSGNTPKWSVAAAPPSYSAGSGIDITSGTVSVNYDNDTLVLNSADNLSVKPSTITVIDIEDPVDDVAVSLTLNNNTIYRINNTATADLASLTISGVSTGFEYAAITFTCGSTAIQFSTPSGWYCVGADCSGGDFIPSSSMRYNLAIWDEDDRIAVYVMEAL